MLGSETQNTSNFFSFRVGRRVPPVHLFFDLDEQPTVVDWAAIHVHEPNEAIAWA